MAASAIILLFLGLEQRNVAGWASQNMRSISVAWSPSVSESMDTSYLTAEEEDEEPEESVQSASVALSSSDTEPIATSYFTAEEEDEEPEESVQSASVALSSSDTEPTGTSYYFAAEEEDEEPEESVQSASVELSSSDTEPTGTSYYATEEEDEGPKESMRSASGALSSSDKESKDISYFTSGKEDEEPEEKRPPLDTLIGDLTKNITGNVEFLLDFAIIGHAKTATTFTMNWLASQDEIQMYGHEMYSMNMGKPAELVSQLYALPAGSQYKRGYKGPHDITSIRALDGIAEYWPDCKLVVGLRHPVSWFESFYNFIVRQGYTMPPADSYIGKCPSNSHGVCTKKAQFHLHLNLLGKTNQTTAHEKQLLKPLPSEVPRLAPMHNQVFLYDISQLGDKDEARAYKYRRDLGSFLGLKHEISPIVHTEESLKYHNDLDICEDRYRPLRRALMDIAKPASEWIRTYFMQSPEVVVSSPEFFNELLLDWMEDPCDKEFNENDPETRRLSY
jgi:hypothetical protein